MTQALQDESRDVRLRTTRALARIRSVDAVPALIQALQDVGVRRSVADALGQIGSGAKDAVPGLIQALLQDEDKSVRVAVVWTLGQLGTPEALKAVEEYQSQQ